MFDDEVIYWCSYYVCEWSWCVLKPCPHCRRKVRQSPNFAVVSPFSATVALFCDSVYRALVYLVVCWKVIRCDITKASHSAPRTVITTNIVVETVQWNARELGGTATVLAATSTANTSLITTEAMLTACSGTITRASARWKLAGWWSDLTITNHESVSRLSHVKSCSSVEHDNINVVVVVVVVRRSCNDIRNNKIHCRFKRTWSLVQCLSIKQGWVRRQHVWRQLPKDKVKATALGGQGRGAEVKATSLGGQDQGQWSKTSWSLNSSQHIFSVIFGLHSVLYTNN